jgi:hypothetical protein
MKKTELKTAKQQPGKAGMRTKGDCAVSASPKVNTASGGTTARPKRRPQAAREL